MNQLVQTGLFLSEKDAVLPNLYSPASEASRKVANLTERKNPHTPVYGVKEFVCLLQILTPIISGLAKQNGLKKIFHLTRPKTT